MRWTANKRPKKPRSKSIVCWKLKVLCRLHLEKSYSNTMLLICLRSLSEWSCEMTKIHVFFPSVNLDAFRYSTKIDDFFRVALSSVTWNKSLSPNSKNLKRKKENFKKTQQSIVIIIIIMNDSNDNLKPVDSKSI